MVTEQRIHSDLAIPPGEYLLEVLEEAGVPQAELARRMGRPIQAINEIANGEKAITPETAIQLEQVVGVPAHIWTSLEAEFQLVKARERDNDNLDKEVPLSTKFPYNELSKQGFVKRTRKRLDRVRELRKFFGVASLQLVPDLDAYRPAFRTQLRVAKSREALAAWLRVGALVAKDMETQRFERQHLRTAIPKIRRLVSSDANGLADSLSNIFSEVGIAFVLMPHFPGTRANGATFWLNSEKAALMISIRGKWADIFWFTLFHEVGHILLHGKRAIFVEGEAEEESNPEWEVQEAEANQFARDTLIHFRIYQGFLEAHDFSALAITELAKTVGTHPGIVVGRLQREKHLGWNQMNSLRTRYEWA